ncbi:MAG TPA: CDP-6-deoxy-delta-3,4-glucoseen reductase [Ottowia sp.]|uniref:CDP-6-deoxy-delta-3,4-glucoseen reductase n=1 Tax=Ottowia sp. TaxID=1898956 RepID=UPI002C9E92A8|nr:CDP-6-deoxy-delta-3,4-glucoseen reductase [Ottowia sp.]HMN22139.1 CDP-6-deoxy-delta-3,4-glucoseen reductase [Ottowia sp.]
MSFTITVEPSGRSFETEPGERILQAGIRQGIGLPYSCQDGTCGSCKVRKLSGTVVHGPHQQKALSDAEEAEGYILTCCGVAQSDVVIESRQVTHAGAFPVRKMPARVALLEPLAADVMRLQLQLPANNDLQYHAGQYLEFVLRDGSRRSYSMASAPHRLMESGAPMLDLHLRHMPGGKFTDHVFGAMKEKEILRIEGPYGSFYLQAEAPNPIILLASGTGFAPIKAMLEHMQFMGITRETVFYWGARRPHDLYMDAWVRGKLAQMPHLSYVPVISDALPEDQWQGRSGLVHRAVLQDFPDLSAHQVYACGTPAMVDAARRDFVQQAGLPDYEFFADAFTSEADKVAG